jgi:hypothetical protein
MLQPQTFHFTQDRSAGSYVLITNIALNSVILTIIFSIIGSINTNSQNFEDTTPLLSQITFHVI